MRSIQARLKSCRWLVIVILLVIPITSFFSSFWFFQKWSRDYFPWPGTNPFTVEFDSVSDEYRHTKIETKLIRAESPASLWHHHYDHVRWFLTNTRNALGKLPLLFVLCQDQLGEIEAMKGYSQYNNTSILLYSYILPPTYMGNVYFYTNILPGFMKDILSRPDDIPWVGTITGDVFASHTDISTLDRILLEYPSRDDIQVMAFGQLHPMRQEVENRLLWEEQEQCCPGLLELFQQILIFHGESPEYVTKFSQLPIHRIQSFSGFCFMVRPTLLPSFIQWLSKIWIYILTDPMIQQGVWSDCTYTSSDEKSNNVRKLPGHVLLGDWLAAYYFSSRDYTIQTMIELPEVNLQYEVPRNDVHPREDVCATAPNRLESVYNLSNATKKSLQDVHVDRQSVLSQYNLSIYRETVQSVPDGSVLVFILCYDAECAANIKNQYAGNPWMYPLILPISYMGDPLLYTKRYLGELIEYLDELIDEGTPTVPWIGTVPGHFLREVPLELSIIQEMIIDQILQQDSDVHVLGFWNPIVYRHLAQILSEDHPGLYELLEYSLLSIGERKEDITRMHTLSLFKPFYGLAFVARPHVVKEFIEWLSRVMLFMFSDPKAHNMLWSLQFQPQHLNPQTVSSILGERLAPYFMNTRGFNIIKNPKEYKAYVHKREVLIRCRSERYMVPEGLGDSYDVFIHYHIGMVNNWKDIVLEQLEKIEVCGLGYIASGMTITYNNPSAEASALDSTREIRSLLYQYDFATKMFSNVTIIDASNQYPFEAKAMECMASLCNASQMVDGSTTETNPKKRIIFYFHDKGCSRYSETDDYSRGEYVYMNHWRQYMEAFLFDRPSLCIRAILNHGASTCGVNLQRHPYKHYSGNFWAASCDYVAGLPSTRDQWRPNDKGFLDFWYEKISPELWIGNFTDRKEGEETKYISLFNIAFDLYAFPAEYDNYQWIFDNVSLYLNGERNSLVIHEEKQIDKIYGSGNLTDLWLDYISSKPQETG